MAGTFPEKVPATSRRDPPVISFHEAIVVGAGPAGLATSRELTRAGVEHRVLEGGDDIGHTWARLYDSLVLHTGRHLSALPGLPLPSTLPIFVPRREFLDYLHRYADTFRLPIETGAEVTSAARDDSRWRLSLRSGSVVCARHLIVATGIAANPYIPAIPDRDRFAGRLIHSVEYRRPDAMNGRRVLVVGAGNSAAEISVELARAGADVSLAVRTGAVIVPRDLLGIPIQYLSVALSPLPVALVQRLTTVVGRLRGPRVLPLPPRTLCPKVPVIGLALAERAPRRNDSPARRRRGVHRCRRTIPRWIRAAVRRGHPGHGLPGGGWFSRRRDSPRRLRVCQTSRPRDERGPP